MHNLKRLDSKASFCTITIGFKGFVRFEKTLSRNTKFFHWNATQQSTNRLNRALKRALWWLKCDFSSQSNKVESFLRKSAFIKPIFGLTFVLIYFSVRRLESRIHNDIISVVEKWLFYRCLYSRQKSLSKIFSRIVQTSWEIRRVVLKREKSGLRTWLSIESQDEWEREWEFERDRDQCKSSMIEVIKAKMLINESDEFKLIKSILMQFIVALHPFKHRPSPIYDFVRFSFGFFPHLFRDRKRNFWFDCCCVRPLNISV